MSKAHDTKISHIGQIRWNASVNLEIAPLQFHKANNF